MSEKVLVTGGTGMLGTPVVNSLLRHGFEVRIFARNAKKSPSDFLGDVDFFNGDLNNKEAIKKALEDVFAVHINLSGEVEFLGVRNIVEIAKESGIKKVTYISGESVSEKNIWFKQTKNKFLAEKEIIESGIKYAIFRPTWFMESIPLFIQNGKAFLIGKPEKKFHLLAAEDYAEIVTEAVKNTDAENKIIKLYGPESYSLTEALEKYVAKVHPEIEKINSLPVWLAKLIAGLGGKKKLKFFAELMDYFEKVGEIGNPQNADKTFGEPKTTFDQWIEKRIA